MCFCLNDNYLLQIAIGECGNDTHNNPCEHICLDLHDGTYECSCFYGFSLSIDGYSCSGSPKSQNSQRAPTIKIKPLEAASKLLRAQIGIGMRESFRDDPASRGSGKFADPAQFKLSAPSDSVVVADQRRTSSKWDNKNNNDNNSNQVAATLLADSTRANRKLTFVNVVGREKQQQNLVAAEERSQSPRLLSHYITRLNFLNELASAEEPVNSVSYDVDLDDDDDDQDDKDDDGDYNIGDGPKSLAPERLKQNSNNNRDVYNVVETLRGNNNNNNKRRRSSENAIATTDYARKINQPAKGKPSYTTKLDSEGDKTAAKTKLNANDINQEPQQRPQMMTPGSKLDDYSSRRSWPETKQMELAHSDRDDNNPNDATEFAAGDAADREPDNDLASLNVESATDQRRSAIEHNYDKDDDSSNNLQENISLEQSSFYLNSASLAEGIDFDGNDGMEEKLALNWNKGKFLYIYIYIKSRLFVSNVSSAFGGFSSQTNARTCKLNHTQLAARCNASVGQRYQQSSFLASHFITVDLVD